MNYTWAGTQSWSASCSASLNQNMIYRGSIDGVGGTGARFVLCYSAEGVIDNYYHEYDIAESWFTGGEGTHPNDDPVENQSDFFSAAAHEFGHTTGSDEGFDGQGHFDEADNADACPNRVHLNFVQDRQTLCPSIPNEETYARTLGVHDIHNFDGAY